MFIVPVLPCSWGLVAPAQLTPSTPPGANWHPATQGPESQTSDTKICEITISQLQAKATDEEMIDGLRNSMRFFGNVVKIVKYTRRGWFEGNAKVFLDKSPMAGKVFEELDRRIYLEDFRGAVVASWANAPSICFKCQRSGHVRDACPEMQRVTCYHCHQKGHYT